MYDVARTAHFERILRSGSPTTVLYSERRYDFDARLAEQTGARRTGLLGAFWYTLRNHIDVLEVAEPLLVRAAPRSFAAIVGARVRAGFRGARPMIVTYAIENKDPRDGFETLPSRTRMKWRAQRLFVRRVWSMLDRVAYGTSQSQNLYTRLLGASRADQRLIPALPVADIAQAGSTPRERTVTFLGEFSERKGFPLLLRAWPEVKSAVPGARLVLIGKGGGETEAHDLAARDDAVTVEIDPPRARIFALLAQTKVLAFASQPRPRWREQVGLPIVEALGRGCLIATTSETGLARWLEEHGHAVIEDPSDASEFAQAIQTALLSTRSPADIVADLPPRDGRADAEHWILTGETGG